MYLLLMFYLYFASSVLMTTWCLFNASGNGYAGCDDEHCYDAGRYDASKYDAAASAPSAASAACDVSWCRPWNFTVKIVCLC